MSKRTNTATWMEKQNRWQIKVQKDNIRKTFYSSTPGRTGQRECNKKADDWLENNILNSKIKVSQACDEYIEQLKLTTSKSHYRQYTYYVNTWIIPKIGNVKVENLTEQHLQSVINEAFHKGLAKKTLSNIKSCQQSFLKYCRACKYTTLFVEGLTIPKSAPVKEKRILQPQDIVILFNNTDILFKQNVIFDIYVYAYRFQVVTGLRPGELIGLQWSDIVGDVVHLKRAININNEVTRGKNDNARRSFKLTNTAKDLLQKQKDLQSELQIHSKYIFTNKYGEVLKQQHYYERWIKYRDYNNISIPVSLYELRHTFVSMVKTLPEGYLKELVGHSKDMDTYGIYSHSFSDDKDVAADMIQNIIDDILTVEEDNTSDNL